MDQYSGKIDGPVRIDQDMSISGMVSGDLIVPRGRAILLSGTVTRDVIIEAGGKATISGTVVGTVINQGGEVHVFGTVGAVRDEGDQASAIWPSAAIKGLP